MDPLFLWLFNKPGSDTGGARIYAFTIGAIVLYADNVILFASSPEEMEKRLDRLGQLGLELNALKCCGISIRGDKRKFSFLDTDVSISVEGTRLSVVTAVKELRHLGVQFNWKGVARKPCDPDQEGNHYHGCTDTT